MESYFVGNPELDRVVGGMLNAVAQSIPRLGRFRTLNVMLLGSFSRGEGVWKSVDGKPRIISDLDILVIPAFSRRPRARLVRRLLEIGRSSGVEVQIRAVPAVAIPLLPKTLDVHEMGTEGKTLYGQEVSRWLPKVKFERPNTNLVLESVFNEALMNVEEITDRDFSAQFGSEQQGLSHRATKTMLRVAHLIHLRHGLVKASFQSAVDDLGESTIGEVPLEVERLMSDIREAFDFRFHEPERLAIAKPLETWNRARAYIRTLLMAAISEEFGDVTLFDLPGQRSGELSVWPRQLSLFQTRKLRRRNITSSDLRTFPTPRELRYSLQSAVFLMYEALGPEIDGAALAHAERLIYNDGQLATRGNRSDRWRRLRIQLIEDHRLGIL